MNEFEGKDNEGIRQEMDITKVGFRNFGRVSVAFLAIVSANNVRAGIEPAPGIELEAAVVGDFLWNVSGGISRDDAQLGNLDITLTIDTEKAGLWSNGTFFFYGLGNTSGDHLPTELIGDIQATSNIEADEAIKLYEAWYEHRFADGRLAILAGLHDYNSEFDVLEHAALFLNSSFGISPDISQAGPSIFPTTALALRTRLQFGEGAYLLAAVYDGVPGDPDDARGTHIRFDDGDGVFAAVEWGSSRGQAGEADYRRVAVGGWYHTAEIEDVRGESEDANGGAYLISERGLNDWAGGFLQLGLADDTANRIDWYLGAGVTATGVVPGREEDVLGLAVAVAVNGDEFRDRNPGFERHETAIELTWLMPLTEQFSIQPDVQYILNPGAGPDIDDALQVGFRAAYEF